MKTISRSNILIFFISLLMISFTSKKKEKLLLQAVYKGISLKCIETVEGRRYEVEVSVTVGEDLETVKSKLLDFPSRCNNDLLAKRKFTPEKHRCAYHNPNIVEFVKFTELKKSTKSDSKEGIDKFLLYVNIFIFNKYEYYELVTVEKKTNNEKEEIVVNYKMINDEQTSKYLHDYRRQRAAFAKAFGSYHLTKVNSKKTLVKMSYTSISNSWPLNADFTMSTILEGSADSFVYLIDALKSKTGEN